jgi:hypothetical protein
MGNSKWVDSVPVKGTPNSSGGQREGLVFYYDANGDLKFTYVGFDANGVWMGPISESLKSPDYREISDGSVFYDPQTKTKKTWKAGVGYQDAGPAAVAQFGSDGTCTESGFDPSGTLFYNAGDKSEHPTGQKQGQGSAKALANLAAAAMQFAGK